MKTWILIGYDNQIYQITNTDAKAIKCIVHHFARPILQNRISLQDHHIRMKNLIKWCKKPLPFEVPRYEQCVMNVFENIQTSDEPNPFFDEEYELEIDADIKNITDKFPKNLTVNDLIAYLFDINHCDETTSTILCINEQNMAEPFPHIEWLSAITCIDATDSEEIVDYCNTLFKYQNAFHLFNNLNDGGMVKSVPNEYYNPIFKEKKYQPLISVLYDMDGGNWCHQYITYETFRKTE